MNVQQIQTALTQLGYAPGAADGIMGPHTHAAILKFQTDHGLTADGIVGPQTEAAINTALAGGGANVPPQPPVIPGAPGVPIVPIIMADEGGHGKLYAAGAVALAAGLYFLFRKKRR